MNAVRYSTALVFALLLCGCASLGAKRGAVATEPLAEPANARAELYAACVHQASGEGGRVEKLAHLVRLTCAGPSAKALFDAAATFSIQRHWDDCAGWLGRCTRYLTPRSWDDQCSRWVSSNTFECRIHIPVGPFLNPNEDVPPTTGPAVK